MGKDIDELMKTLENGVQGVFNSESYKEYLDFMGKFYDYSACNCMLILMQCPEASLVAGYNTWKAQNRQVRKGEKAIKIIAPCPHKKEREIIDADGNRTTEDITWTSFRAVNVFDVSQTDGEELPKHPAKKLEGSFEGYSGLIERLKAFSEVPVLFEDIKVVNGYFSGAEGVIKIKQGMSEQQTIKTLIHEIAHSILHKKGGEESEADRRTREVQAESVAYMVSGAVGLDTAEYSFGYIAGWSGSQEVKELTASMDVIKKTVKRIIEGIERG